MIDDSYKEIKTQSTGVYKEKGSKFISYSFPVYSIEEVKEKLSEIRKSEHSASHYCYAYILGTDKSYRRANDDGEPSSSAGRPILRQILSHNLTNILIVVVRYFGGVKLGIPGLIRSYKNAAEDTISNSKILIKNIKEEYELSFKYVKINDVMRLVKEFDLEIIRTDFQIDCTLIFAVIKSKSDSIVEIFKKNHELSIKYLKKV